MNTSTDSHVPMEYEWQEKLAAEKSKLATLLNGVAAAKKVLHEMKKGEGDTSSAATAEGGNTGESTILSPSGDLNIPAETVATRDSNGMKQTATVRPPPLDEDNATEPQAMRQSSSASNAAKEEDPQTGSADQAEIAALFTEVYKEIEMACYEKEMLGCRIAAKLIARDGARKDA